MAGYIGGKAVNLSTSGADISGTANLDIVDVDGAANFAADVTFADGADIITASAGTSNFRAGVNAGNSIASGGNYNVVVGDEAGTAITTGDQNVAIGFGAASALPSLKTAPPLAVRTPVTRAVVAISTAPSMSTMSRLAVPLISAPEVLRLTALPPMYPAIM